MSQGEFSVYWWDPTGTYHEELRFVDPKTAVEMARSLTQRPAAKLGIIERIIITDGGDCITFEWKKDEGVVFPPRSAKGEDHGAS